MYRRRPQGTRAALPMSYADRLPLKAVRIRIWALGDLSVERQTGEMCVRTPASKHFDVERIIRPHSAPVSHPRSSQAPHIIFVRHLFPFKQARPLCVYIYSTRASIADFF